MPSHATKTTPQELRALTERMIAAGALRPGTRLARLLDYLLEAELAGAGDRLKAYAIGVDVLGRGPDFDPSTDSIARVEVGRLRKLLEAYYAGPGAQDPLRVAIPRGQMRPVIGPMPPETGPPAGPAPPEAVPPAPSTPGVGALRIVLLLALLAAAGLLAWNYLGSRRAATDPADPAPPIVEVGPFTSALNDPAQAYLVPGLRADLVRVLSQVHTLRVRDNPAGLAPPPAGLPAPDYRITAQLRPDPAGLVFDLTLTETGSGTIVWVGSETYASADMALATPLRDRLPQLIQAIAGPTGLVATEELRQAEDAARATADRSASTYACYLLWAASDVTKDPEQLASAGTCLTDLVAADTPDGLIWAAYAFRSFIDWSESGGQVGDAAYRAAEAAARHAVALAPLASEAHEYLSGILAAGGRLAEAGEEIREAIRLNPSQPDLQVALGWQTCLAGRWDEGLELVRQGSAMAVATPGWFDLPPAFDAIRRADWAGAQAAAERMLAAGDPRGRAIAVLAASELGQAERLRALLTDPEAGDRAALGAAVQALKTLFPNPEVAWALDAAFARLPAAP